MSRRIPASPIDRAHSSEVDWASAAEVFQAVRHVEGNTFVYCIGEEERGAVKIGISTDPIQRLRAMQTGNPRRLCVERVLLGDHEVEQLIHEMWEPLRILSARSRVRPGDAAPLTEWFAPEIRDTLFPVIDAAAPLQVRYVEESLLAEELLSHEKMELLFREAVQLKGFVPHRREEKRLLSRAGYFTPRRSRV